MGPSGTPQEADSFRRSNKMVIPMHNRNIVIRTAVIQVGRECVQWRAYCYKGNPITHWGGFALSRDS